MLKSLFVKDVVLIQELQLHFNKGLNVLTGETGAGKSILLDALGLALGMRAEGGLIRKEATQAVVIAQFSLPYQEHTTSGEQSLSLITTLLDEHGLMGEEEEEGRLPLVMKRILTQASADQPIRSRAFINDYPVSVQLLRQIGDEILEIHGQFDRLLNPASHREFLDLYEGLVHQKSLVHQAYNRWKDALDSLNSKKTQIEESHQRFDLLTFHLQELDALSPLPEEETTLLEERQLLLNSGKIHQSFQDAWKELSQPNRVTSTLNAAYKKLSRIQEFLNEEQKAVADKLDQITVDVEDCLSHLQTWALSGDNNESRLQVVEERLSALREMARKHGVSPLLLAQFHTQLKEKLDAYERGAEDLKALESQVSVLKDTYIKEAKALQAARLRAINNLDQGVMNEFPALKLERAQFQTFHTSLKEEEWGPEGIDKIEFKVAMNKGQEFSSLAKSASGGELSRIMLALKVVLANRSSIPTIIFDEIDAGVGGAVADSIGERLYALSKPLQVFAITHSPQVASWADEHFYVHKSEQGAQHIVTQVRPLSLEERKEEIARMLAGEHITPEARAAADKLMDKKTLKISNGTAPHY